MKELHSRISHTILTQQDALAEQIVARQYEQQAELWAPFGEEGRQKAIRDVKYHVMYLTEALQANDPSLFSDYVAWVKELFAGLHLPDETMIGTLECIRDTFHSALPAEFNTLLDVYLEAGLQKMISPLEHSPSFVQEEMPLQPLLQRFMNALLQGERHVASRHVLEAVEQGVDIKDIYLHVFQRSQYEIGRLWMSNQVSVAQEHYCTAATQLIMSQLYPYIFASNKIGRRLVATCIGGELHEIGVRMVADFFEMEGWDTYYIGANTPASTILDTLAERQPDVLGISATMTFHISLVEELIQHVRASEMGQHLKILVGGYPFSHHEDLWRSVGADGFGKDALEAITAANQLLREATI